MDSWTCASVTHKNASFCFSRMSISQKPYFWRLERTVDLRKLKSLTVKCQTFRRTRSWGKLGCSDFLLPTSSLRANLKRDPIGFSDIGYRNFVKVIDRRRNKQHLENHLLSLRNAIAMDNTPPAAGVIDKLVSLPLTDDTNKYEELSELEDQLHDFFIGVKRMIETGDERTARELVQANYEAVIEQLDMGVQGVEQAAMLDILAQLNMCLHEFKVAEGLLEQIKEITTNVMNHEPLVDKILEHMGSMYTALRKPEEALPLYLRSLHIQEGVLGKDNPLLVNLLLGLAMTYNALGEGHKSMEHYAQAISILESTKSTESEDLVLPLTHLSHVLLEENKVDEAVDALHRALGILEKLHGENDGRVGSVMCVLARALSSKGEVKDAVSLYKKGMQTMEKDGYLLFDDPTLETIRTDLAELLHVLGRDQESQQLWEKNLLIKEKALGIDHPGLAVHLQNLATSYAFSGKYDKCEYLLRRCLRILSATLVPDAPEISVPMLCLATTLYHQGRYKEAENLAQEALRMRETSSNKESTFVGEACDSLAVIKHALGKDEEAEPLMWRVLHIQEKEFGYHSPELINTLKMLIAILDNLGKKNERLFLLRRLVKYHDLMPKTNSML